jgi:hypothetical protein
LPYNSAQASKGITVATRRFTETGVSPSQPWTAGQTVTLKCRLLEDSTPVPGATVDFYVFRTGWPDMIKIGSAATDSQGYASLSWRIAWTLSGRTLPCDTIYFFAMEAGGAYAQLGGGKCAYPTRLSISAPDKVRANEEFTVSGRLEYESGDGVWSGLGGMTVSVYYNSTKVGDATTGSDGSYSIKAKISTGGTYTLKAAFAGQGLGLAPAVARLALSVGAAGAVVAVAAPVAVGAILALLARRT